MATKKAKKKAPALDRKNYTTLSFDCYGTLIDWENGILGYLQPLFESFDVHVIDDWVLEYYSQVEPEMQQEGGSYRSVLARVLEKFGARLAFQPGEDALAGFSSSIEYWPPFPDTVAAMASLKEHFELIALSNIDDELFAYSAKAMDEPFTHIITAERVGAYKPDSRMFETLLEVATGPILHVAESRYHDIVPATAIGLDTVWINRPTIGATREVEAEPTWTFDSMAAFAAAWK